MKHRDRSVVRLPSQPYTLFKPFTGLIDFRHGLLPSSTTFDAPGRFGKSAWDHASLLPAVAGYDIKDLVTLEALAYESQDFTTNLASEWSDWRLGIADRKWFWSLYDHQMDGLEGRDMFNHGISTVVQIRDLGANCHAQTTLSRLGHGEVRRSEKTNHY